MYKVLTLIIVDIEGVQIGAIVDSINRVLPVSLKDVSEVPELTSQVNAKYIEGIYRRENSLTILLDLAGVLDISDLKFVNKKNIAA